MGSINHELGIRGRKELEAASSCFLKGKSFDLIELKPVDEFIKYRKLIGTINQLIADWKKMQDELKAKGLDQKRQASLATKKRKMNDPQKSKSYGGPFTTAEEVDQMLENTELSDAQKSIKTIHRSQICQGHYSIAAQKISNLQIKRQLMQKSSNGALHKEHQSLP